MAKGYLGFAAGQFISRPEYERRNIVTIQQTDESRPNLALPLARAGQIVSYVLGRTRIINPVPLWYGNIKNIIETTKEEKTDTREVDITIKNIGGIYIPGAFEENQIPEESDIATISGRAGEGNNIPYNRSTSKLYETNTTTTLTRKVVGYSLDVAIGVCLGPGVELLAIYSDDTPIWQGTLGVGRSVVAGNNDPDSILKNGFIYHSGEFDQTPEPYLSGKVTPGYHIGYVGTAYIVLQEVEAALLQSANLTFEVRRAPNPLALATGNTINVDDLNPASAAVDIMLNEWGAVGIDETWINAASFETAAALFASEQIGVSYAVAQENSGARLLREIQTTTNSLIFADPETGLITIKALRALPYDPDTLVKLDPSNVSSVQRMDKPAFVGMPTHLGVTFYDRTSNYDSKTVTSRNPVVPQSPTRAQRINNITLSGVCTAEIAENVFDVLLTAISAPLLSFSLVADRNAADLKQGDLFLLTWPQYALEAFPVYLTKLREQDNNANVVVIDCQQYARPSVNKFFKAPTPTAHLAPDMNQKPPLEVRAITAPWWLARRYGFDNTPNYENLYGYPIFLASGANEQQLAFDVYTVDGSKLIEGAPYGMSAKLVDPLPKLAGHREWIVPEIKLRNVVNRDYLVNLTDNDIATGQRLIIINDEFFAYTEAVDNVDGTVSLKNVHRGLLDTVANSHAAGDTVYGIDLDSRRLSTKGHKFDDGEFTYSIASRAYRNSGAYPTDAVALTYTGINRGDWPLRPQFVQIDDERTELPINVYVGSKTVVRWLTRSRMNQQITTGRIDDDTDLNEIMSNNKRQAHFVTLTDSLGAVFNLACSLVGDEANNYTTLYTDYAQDFVTFDIPAGAAAGPAILDVTSNHVIYVEADAEADPNYWPQVIRAPFQYEELDIYINPVQPFEVVLTFNYGVE